MFKKLIALALGLLLVSGFAGCSKEKTQPQNKESTTAQIQNQPEQTSLLLIPYMAGFAYDESDGLNNTLYGLVTADGNTAVEPDYNTYSTMEFDGKTYYCMKVAQGDWEQPEIIKSLLVSADGKWQLEIEDNVVALSENRIICAQYDGPFTVYDYSGNKIFSGNEYQTVDTNGSGYYNGLLVVFDFLSDNGYTTVVNENGEVVLDKLDYCGPFVTGKAVASYNRYEGYGIITPDGEWLLEPKYTDIKTVDGKYFIAIDFDREYIYDADLNLLRERECGWAVEDQSYFFELDGKLVREYSHADSPDDYFRNAFTDEIVACNGVYATKYYEGLGLFSGVAGDKFCIFDVNGKLLNECEGAERLEYYDDAYATVDSSGKAIWFSAVTHEQIITLTSTESEWKYVSTIGDCGVAVIAELEKTYDSRAEGVYHLYDYKKGEYISKDCEYCSINEFNGKAYVTAVYEDRIETYDSDMNLIIKTDIG